MKNSDEVAFALRRFPIAKADNDERVDRDSILAFIFGFKNAANVADERVFGDRRKVVFEKRDVAHAVAEKFGDLSVAFSRVARDIVRRERRIDVFASEALVFGAAGSVFDHVESV